MISRYISNSTRVSGSIFRFYCSVNSTSKVLTDYSKLIPKDGNVTSLILDKVGKNLHSMEGHPINIIKKKIQYHFKNNLSNENTQFKFFDEFHPRVTVEKNFNDLLFPNDHIGRSPNDTYYFSQNELLRTHTSAHQTDLMRSQETAFLVTGDVYRRDTIDAVHYPVFHQMEGVKIFPQTPDSVFSKSIDYYTNQDYKDLDSVKLVENDLKKSLESMIKAVIGQDLQIRWIDAYFPFTSPSWEMEILFQDQWLEVLGCGVVHPEIMKNCQLEKHRGWAFGLGLERLAMILFNIPDIRLFWTEDKRFHQQFQQVKYLPNGDIDLKQIKFQPFSKYPSCFKDISFWLGKDFHENTFMEFVRQICGDLVEKVELVDHFENKKTSKSSSCYRIHYRSMERSLTNQEIDLIQQTLRDQIENKVDCKLR
ncbi:phenylalanine-tRNA synthetase [Tieghemostelium lacteum]|uniref:phenylalanine--tRNA ligase n=1 Tax=Tieghemostelium lacteum TaxID=361077 RepID=A0A151ZG98_TIELA|nr:phenylalanine-tRNA synthetase [Tieghemostelium lacteum]|eukprot:KYQ92939.1 phenylalanine-tRNA synthetase [Tieghemostelium lacteum]